MRAQRRKRGAFHEKVDSIRFIHDKIDPRGKANWQRDSESRNWIHQDTGYHLGAGERSNWISRPRLLLYSPSRTVDAVNIQDIWYCHCVGLHFVNWLQCIFRIFDYIYKQRQRNNICDLILKQRGSSLKLNIATTDSRKLREGLTWSTGKNFFKKLVATICIIADTLARDTDRWRILVKKN